ncbi:MAG: sensor histidine kinase [Bacteroidota bacterium]
MLHRFLFSILLLAYPLSTLNAQTPIIDSLKAELPNLKEDTLAAGHLYYLSWLLWQIDPRESMEYSQQALVIAEKEGWKMGIGKGHIMIGVAHFHLSQLDSALIFYEKALKVYQEIGNLERVSAVLNNKGNVLVYMGDYEGAIEQLLAALELKEQLGDSVEVARGLQNIGNVFYSLQRMEEAERYYLEALYALPKTSPVFNVVKAGIYNNLGITNSNLGRPDSSIAFYKKAMNIHLENGNKKDLAGVYDNLGVAHSRIGKFELSYEYAQKAVALYKEVENQYGIALSYQHLGSVAHELKRDKESIAYLNESLKISRENNLTVVEGSTYEVLAQSQANLGEYEAAFTNLWKANEIEDSLRNETVQQQVSELETKYETERKDREIAEQELYIQQQNTRIILLLGGIIGLLIIGGLFYNRTQLQQRQMLNEQLIEQQSLRLKAVIETQEQERSRIAKDLHDGIGQSLSATRLNFGALSHNLPADTKSDYTHAMELLDDACTELRSIAHSMLPRTLSEEGLPSALEELLQRSLSQTSLAYHFDNLGVQNRLPQHIEVGFYRITQELINNVIKHAEATEVTVQLLKTGSSINLSVEDNGKGLDPNQASQGMGLTNIHTRAEAIGASFRTESGKGTRALLKWMDLTS